MKLLNLAGLGWATSPATRAIGLLTTVRPGVTFIAITIHPMHSANLKAQFGEDSVPPPMKYVPGNTTQVNKSWRDLYKKLGALIRFKARQAGLNDHSADDVLQEVMVTVMRAQLGEVAGHDPAKGRFKAWLMGVVHNRIRSELRRGGKETPLSPLRGSETTQNQGALPEIPQAPPDFREIEEQRWREALHAAALQKVRARVNPDNFAIFMALQEERATPEQLAETYGKTRNNIDQINDRCRKMFEVEAKALYQSWAELGKLPL